MFDRSAPKFTDKNNWRDNLQRFGNDEYAAKYLSGVYNPEFKIRVTCPKDRPEFSMTGKGIGWSDRKFEKEEDVF